MLGEYSALSLTASAMDSCNSLSNFFPALPWYLDGKFRRFSQKKRDVPKGKGNKRAYILYPMGYIVNIFVLQYFQKDKRFIGDRYAEKVE